MKIEGNVALDRGGPFALVKLSKTFARGNFLWETRQPMKRKPPPRLTVVPALAPDAPPPPATLGATGCQLWRSILWQYDIPDAAGLSILEQACAAADVAAECAGARAEHGPLIRTPNGPKDHPLLRHELAARALIGRLLARLNLDVEPLHAHSGRPPNRNANQP